MDPRKRSILQAIIENFIETAEPVGSETVLLSYKLTVSPATIRNDMAFLEKEGLIIQPHTSAGRIPTDIGYKLYVQEIADLEATRHQAANFLKTLRHEYHLRQAKEKIYEAVSLLAQASNNVSFATLPNNNRTFYIGISNILKQPEFQKHPLEASQVIEILEEGRHFMKTLHQLDLDQTIKVFIGHENLLPQIESCGLIVTKYQIGDYEGTIGILGPKRMNYPFNMVVLEEVRNLLEE